MAQGLAHRIERWNAFAACLRPGTDHAPLFLICRVCQAVSEAQTAPGPLDDAARAAGFAVERRVMEAEGLCPNCQKTAA